MVKKLSRPAKAKQRTRKGRCVKKRNNRMPKKVVGQSSKRGKIRNNHRELTKKTISRIKKHAHRVQAREANAREGRKKPLQKRQQKPSAIVQRKKTRSSKPLRPKLPTKQKQQEQPGKGAKATLAKPKMSRMKATKHSMSPHSISDSDISSSISCHLSTPSESIFDNSKTINLSGMESPSSVFKELSCKASKTLFRELKRLEETYQLSGADLDCELNNVMASGIGEEKANSMPMVSVSLPEFPQKKIDDMEAHLKKELGRSMKSLTRALTKK